MNPRTAQRQYDSECDCCQPGYHDGEETDAVGKSARDDADRLAEIIEAEVQKLGGETVVEMLTAMFTARNTGLIRSVANGTPAPQWHPSQLDAFRDLADRCDYLSDIINDAVDKEAGDELDRQMGEAA